MLYVAMDENGKWHGFQRTPHLKRGKWRAKGKRPFMMSQAMPQVDFRESRAPVMNMFEEAGLLV